MNEIAMSLICGLLGVVIGGLCIIALSPEDRQ